MGSTVTVRTWIAFSCALLVPVAILLSARLSGAQPHLGQSGIQFEVSGLEVLGELPLQTGVAFSTVSADMDRDGDLDLLINWHVLGQLELFENCGGAFRILNTPGNDSSGLYENRGVPDLYASTEEQVARIQDQGSPGLYVWHDPDRDGFWRFYLWRESDAILPVILDFEANQPILDLTGLAPEEVTRLRPESIQIRIRASGPRRLFGAHVNGISTQAILGLVQPDLQVFVGRHLSPVAGEFIKLWKPDPHGLAWVHVTGSPEPELFLTRGTNTGNIAPPFDPKNDRFYEWVGGQSLYSMAAEDLFPQTYGRGRQVAWVDVHNDGTNELYIGNRSSSNSLAVLDPVTGVYRERASSHGLDILDGESSTWIDFDDDGYQDLLHIVRAYSQGQIREEIGALRNLQGTGFAPVDPAALGLVLENPGRGSKLFPRLAFHVTDFDNDGLLDVLVSGNGEELGIELFLRRGSQYQNVTTSVGLEPVDSALVLLPFDADNDSYVDLLKVHLGGLELLHNDGGKAFFTSPIYFGLFPSSLRAATVTDVDSDGLQDILIASTTRQVVHNFSDVPNRFLEVRFLPMRQEPIGALVSAHYSNGKIQVQRYGSANNPLFCQSLPPLHFGIPHGSTIRYLSVLWPGDPVPTMRRIREEEIGTTIDI